MRKAIVLGLLCLPAFSHADIYRYAEFFASQTGIPGSMTGQIVVSPTQTVGISYSGNVVAESQINDTGTYYYTGYNGGPSYYTNAVVQNAPSRTDIIALSGQTTNVITNTITFSAPVKNPIMDIVSLGSPAQLSHYDFSTPFTILSQGPGYWGSGSMWTNDNLRLYGMEGSGVIMFSGTYTSISFTASPFEYWSGFTVGVVPEPSSMLAIGLGGALLLRRRKRA
ncbi:MAG: PEP-CTERM sorting domain-containing protein [Armatimonadetes bacterium]|nr:PEP-CTERM sorting domain-containing protein [Armatimonadota bacterium]